MKKIILLFTMLLTISAFSQVTTSKIKGVVKDEAGSLFGASVVAKHLPSGTIMGAMTQENGSYSLPNLRVGGPYTVTFSFVGYKTVEYSDIYLSLGKTQNIDAKMVSENQELDEVVIKYTKDNTFNSGRTGSEMSVGKKELTTLPTISRSQADFTRLEPSASGGSFGGRNDQYNNFSLDGSIFNNPFGLDAATPGGQTDAQPVSLDAIDQISVSTAPYDITQAGFTGASVNAVTKSGTNTFKGTVYSFYRNQDMTGSKVKGETIFVPELNHFQGGFSLGGPIVKDKVFFFMNVERENRIDAGSSWVPDNGDGTHAINEASVLESDMILVKEKLAALGYDTGDYKGFTYLTESWKGIAKLDFNLDKNNRLALIYNFLNASKEKPAHPTALGFRGPNASTLQFENTGYQINNELNSFLAELNSNMGNGVSNKLQIGYTHFNDFRNPLSVAAPTITIQNGAGANYIIAGHEPFSIHNKLDQRVFQFTNNLNFVLGDHVFTVGLSYEKFKFGNSFNLGSYGAAGVFFPSYGSMADFVADANPGGGLEAQLLAAQQAQAALEESGEGVAGGWNYYKINVGQGALYMQDEFSLNEDLTLTFGIRADKPFYYNTSQLAQEFADTQCCYIPSLEYTDPATGEAFYFDSTKMPTNNFIFSPRFGFNWDFNGDKKLQLRGGTGIFTGRLPFVWLGNQVGAPNFWFYQAVDPDFQWPKVWKSSFGIDKKFENDLTLTLDASYSKDLKAAHVQNWALKTPESVLQGADNRPIYGSADVGNPPFYNAAYVLTNSNKGYAMNISTKVQKRFENGLFTSIAYNFMDSKDVNSIEAEITGDAYVFNPAYGNVNNDVLSYSKYGDKHRVVGLISKRFDYSNDKMYSSFSTVFEYAQGGRFSYTYGGDINNDGSGLNDLIYIPKADEIATMQFTGDAASQAAQATAFENFIKQDAYLNSRRGLYAERYGAISPIRGRWDFKYLQGFKIQGNTGIELTLDVLNLGNLFNSNWGVMQIPNSVQPIGVNVGVNDNGTPADASDDIYTPIYTFSENQEQKTFVNDNSLLSRWQVQGGVRLLF
jgi:hypothetical protein